MREIEEKFKYLSKKLFEEKRKELESIKESLIERSLLPPHSIAQLDLSYLLLKKSYEVEAEKFISKHLFIDLEARKNGNIKRMEIEGIPYRFSMRLHLDSESKAIDWDEVAPFRINGKIVRYAPTWDDDVEFYLFFYWRDESKNLKKSCENYLGREYNTLNFIYFPNKSSVQICKKLFEYFSTPPEDRDKNLERIIYKMFRAACPYFPVKKEEIEKKKLNGIYALDSTPCVYSLFQTKEFNLNFP